MVDWLIVSGIYFLPAVLVVAWLAIALPRLLASAPPRPPREESPEASLADIEHSYEKVARLRYVQDKEQRDQQFIDTVESALRRHTEQDLHGAETLAQEMKSLHQTRRRQQQEEQTIDRRDQRHR